MRWPACQIYKLYARRMSYLRSYSLLSELSLDLAVLADSAGTRTTGTTRNMECEFATRIRSFCYSGLTGTLLRRIEKLAIVENVKKTALSN